MYEHGLIPSDYTERPIYQTERSLELQHELCISADLIDDMLRLPKHDDNTLRHSSIEGGGCRIMREFNYYHPQHQEVVVLRIDYESRPLYKSETYSVALDTYAQTSYVNETALTTHYVLHKNADTITSAGIQSLDLEQGGYYAERAMTVYDARQLFNELAEFSVTACQSLSNE
jgi:hypothetical protein